LLLRAGTLIYSGGRRALVAAARRSAANASSVTLPAARDSGVCGRQWRQLDHMQTICTSLQTDNHTNTSSVNFTGRTLF